MDKPIEILNEADEAVEKLNEILSEFLFEKYGDSEFPIFELQTNGTVIIITFMDFRIWFSDIDDRKYKVGTNEFEPLEGYLKREGQKLIDRICSLKEVLKGK